MAFYPGIDPATEEGRRIAGKLLSLRSLISGKKTPKESATRGIPAKTADKSLLLATWNIREFGRNKMYGARLFESLYYIAEIISAFDLVALQEVNENLTDLRTVMSLLGPSWKYLLSDITLGRQGNGERTAFLYDSRKLTFSGLASQVVLPPLVKKGGREYQPQRQLARSPMMVGFRSGWLKFVICTAHIYYGEARSDQPTRLEEITLLAEYLAQRVTSPFAWASDMFLLGDFNIFKPSDVSVAAIQKAGFFIPPQLLQIKNPAGKHYDQIALYSRKYAKQQQARALKAAAGVVNFFDKVFTDAEEKLYAAYMGKKYRGQKGRDARRQHYRRWRTFQMSDHRPMWIEITTDFSAGYLANAMRGKGKKFAIESNS